MANELQTHNFYGRLDELCNPSKMYTSFHVQKAARQYHSLTGIAKPFQSTFLPFVNERDGLGRLIQDKSQYNTNPRTIKDASRVPSKFSLTHSKFNLSTTNNRNTLSKLVNYESVPKHSITSQISIPFVLRTKQSSFLKRTKLRKLLFKSQKKEVPPVGVYEVNDSLVRSKAVPNIYFARKQFGAQENNEQNQITLSHSRFASTSTLKNMKSTNKSTTFAKAKGRNTKHAATMGNTIRNSVITSRKQSGLAETTLRSGRGMRLPEVFKRDVEDLAKKEMEVYQRFLMYLQSEKQP